MKKRIEAVEIEENLIKLISQDWFLISSGDKKSFNTMTASWGGMGFLWNKPVAFVFIRPERYTHEFVEINNTMTLSLLRQDYKDALMYLGRVSGRDEDKISKTGLTPCYTPNGNPTFSEAKLVIEGKKLFKAPLEESSFLDKESVAKWYGEKGGFHDMYIIEIENVWIE